MPLLALLNGIRSRNSFSRHKSVRLPDNPEDWNGRHSLHNRSRHPEAIVATKSGTRVLNRKLSGYHFNKLVELVQVPKIRFHDLRHTFASWYMIEVGDIWSLKGILGHVDVQTTQRYAHLSQRHQKMPAFSFHAGK